ncbi:uncharacterized protein LOC113389323 [Ctenocephalides felis]|uniref:uncharacterized protein LOC113389323 n=1 Tax=Ctenocephalides felis TaxID=7515 RepID=UPI000E6E10F7|nr:uncharacterized protein LOC113389323 [Ctenocephalides felis]
MSITPRPNSAAASHGGLVYYVVAVPRSEAWGNDKSNESGWDNPFRPDGELSREADAIVSLIKGGQPITPVAGEPPSTLLNSSALSNNSSSPGGAVANGNAATVTDGSPATNGGGLIKKDNATTLSSAVPATASSPTGKNGTAATSPAKGGASSPVAVQRGTVPQQSTPQQAELVVLKKKPKCKCCVIQ